MLFMRFIWGIFLFAVTFLPASAVPVYPKPIALLLKSGFSSIRSFPAKSNLTGYILKHNGQYLIVYVTPDQQSLLTGELIDANGNDLNISYAKQYLPNSSLNQQFLHLKQTKTINEGDNIHPKKTLFVFFDPNCVFCHLLWKALQPYEKIGLQVRWVPVAFLKQSSFGRADAIMTAQNPLLAFKQNETKYAHDSGGIAPSTHVSTQFKSMMASNNELMNAFGGNGTPTLVWQDKKGHIQALSGMPSLSDLPAITGLPKQVNHDPELNRFQ